MEDFEQRELGEMEEMNLGGGFRRFLQITGRALIIIKQVFFRMEEVDKGRGEKERNENRQVENSLHLLNDL